MDEGIRGFLFSTAVLRMLGLSRTRDPGKFLEVPDSATHRLVLAIHFCFRVKAESRSNARAAVVANRRGLSSRFAGREAGLSAEAGHADKP